MTLHSLLLIAAISLGSRGYYENYQRTDIPTGTLYSWGWSPAEVAKLGRTIPIALGEIEQRIGKRLGGPFTSVLTPDGAEFRRVVQKVSGGAQVAETVVGVAVPRARTLVIRGGLFDYAGLEETLYHEIAHLVIHAGRAEPVPRWLDEGVAMWASRHRLTPSDEGFVALRARLGRLYTLRSLADEFPTAHRSTSTAYMQSLLFVTFLVERHRRDIVPRLLDRISRDNADEVLSDLTGTSVQDLETAFSEWVIARTSLLWPLLSLWNIWTAAALLAVLAIVRSRLRRRRVLRRLEQAESEERPGGSGTPARDMTNDEIPNDERMTNDE